MNKFTFSFGLILLGVMALLIYLASEGNITAIATLAVVVTVILILTGVSITLIANHIASMREQRQFMTNAKENFMLVKQTQDLINVQNRQLWFQTVQQAKLPEPTNNRSENDIITIDESLFTDFED